MNEAQQRLDWITDKILHVAMAHHSDISKSDEDNAVKVAEVIDNQWTMELSQSQAEVVT